MQVQQNPYHPLATDNFSQINDFIQYQNKIQTQSLPQSFQHSDSTDKSPVIGYITVDAFQKINEHWGDIMKLMMQPKPKQHSSLHQQPQQQHQNWNHQSNPNVNSYDASQMTQSMPLHPNNQGLISLPHITSQNKPDGINMGIKIPSVQSIIPQNTNNEPKDKKANDPKPLKDPGLNSKQKLDGKNSCSRQRPKNTSSPTKNQHITEPQPEIIKKPQARLKSIPVVSIDSPNSKSAGSTNANTPQAPQVKIPESQGQGTRQARKKSMGPTEAPHKRSKYQIFVGINMREVKSQNPEIPGSELMKIVSANWRKLSPEEKEKFGEESNQNINSGQKTSVSPQKQKLSEILPVIPKPVIPGIKNAHINPPETFSPDKWTKNSHTKPEAKVNETPFGTSPKDKLVKQEDQIIGAKKLVVKKTSVSQKKPNKTLKVSQDTKVDSPSKKQTISDDKREESSISVNDSTKRRRSVTPFYVFQQIRRQEIETMQGSGLQLSIAEKNKQIAQEWRQMKDEQRSKFEINNTQQNEVKDKKLKGGELTHFYRDIVVMNSKMAQNPNPPSPQKERNAQSVSSVDETQRNFMCQDIKKVEAPNQSEVVRLDSSTFANKTPDKVLNPSTEKKQGSPVQTNQRATAGSNFTEQDKQGSVKDDTPMTVDKDAKGGVKPQNIPDVEKK